MSLCSHSQGREAGGLQSGYSSHPASGSAVSAWAAVTWLDHGRLQQHQRHDRRDWFHWQRHYDLRGRLQHQTQHWGQWLQQFSQKTHCAFKNEVLESLVYVVNLKPYWLKDSEYYRDFWILLTWHPKFFSIFSPEYQNWAWNLLKNYLFKMFIHLRRSN